MHLTSVKNAKILLFHMALILLW